MASANVMNVSYSQIAVFDGDLDSPFNDWTSAHVGQGFAWRPHSVSFKTLLEYGPVDVGVHVSDSLDLLSDVVRAIAVPYSVCDRGVVSVATIEQEVGFNLPAGDYRLVFQTGWRSDRAWVDFTFVRGGDSSPEVIVQDSELNPPSTLLMVAEPA